MSDAEQDEATLKAQADAALMRLGGKLDALDSKERAAVAMIAPVRYHPGTVAAVLSVSLLFVVSGLVFAIRHHRRPPRSMTQRGRRAWQALTEG
jgi:hypothetical protein